MRVRVRIRVCMRVMLRMSIRVSIPVKIPFHVDNFCLTHYCASLNFPAVCFDTICGFALHNWSVYEQFYLKMYHSLPDLTIDLNSSP